MSGEAGRNPGNLNILKHKTMFKMLLYVVLSLVALVALVWISGMLLPRTRSVSLTRTLNVPAEQVYKTVTDIQGQPRWRPELTSVTVVSAEPGREEWLEVVGKQPPMRFRTLKKVENERFEVQFEGSGFTGSWTGVFRTTGNNQTEVIFTEQTDTPGAFARVFATLFVPLDKLAGDYLSALEAGLKAGK